MEFVLPAGVQPATSGVESAVPFGPRRWQAGAGGLDRTGTSCLEDRHAAHYATPARRNHRSHDACVMAESTGIEPVHPEGLDALASRCLAARPTLQLRR